MQMEQVFKDGSSLFWYEPADLHPTTLVFWYSECGEAGGPFEISLLYLCTSFDDFQTMVRNSAAMAGASVDEIQALWTELSDHAFQQSPATAAAGFELQGTILDYLADDYYQRLMLAMLAFYCENKNWQDILGPEPAVVASRLEGKTALAIPGDEDLVALAINLFNSGADAEVDVEDEEDEEDEEYLEEEE
jgi:hypothetical protein